MSPSPAIAIVTAYFPPQSSAGANRLESFLLGFLKGGADVRVFAPHFRGDDLAAAAAEVAGHTTWMPSKPISRRGFVRRFADELWIAWRLFRKVERSKYDYILITSPYISLILFSTIFVRRSQLVIDIRDLTWEYNVSGNPIIQMVQRVLGAAVLRALSRARLVCTSTPDELAYLKARLRGPRLVCISNGIEEAFVRRMAGEPATVRPDATVVLYAGTIGKAQGAAVLLAMAAKRPDVHFRLIGEGDEAPRIAEAARSSDLWNLTVSGRIARSKLENEYQEADILFLRLTPGYHTAIPSKIYEYVSTGKPVIYMGDDSDAAWKRLSEFDGVYRVDHDDLEHFNEAVSLAKSRGCDGPSNQRAIMKAYTREALAEALLKQITAQDHVAATKSSSV